MAEPNDPPEELTAAIGCSDEEPIGVFARSVRGAIGYWAGLIAFVLVGCATVALGAVSDRWEGYAFLGVAALALFGAGFWWRAQYRRTADLVYLYEYGAVWRTPRDGWAAGRWADAVAVWRIVTQDGDRVRVEFADGRAFQFAARLKEYQELAAQVQRAVHRHLLPIARSRLDAGETVEFGPVTLTKDEIVIYDVRHPLRWVRVAGFLFGELWLNRYAHGPDSAVVPLNRVPNYTVLAALLPVVPHNWNPAAFE